MKKVIFIFVTGWTLVCCQSDDSLDCTGEDAFVDFLVTPDESIPRKFEIRVLYTGDYTVGSVKWEFPTGASTEGVLHFTTYTFADEGSYEVTAKLKLLSGGSSCWTAKTVTFVVD